MLAYDANDLSKCNDVHKAKPKVCVYLYAIACTIFLEQDSDVIVAEGADIQQHSWGL